MVRRRASIPHGTITTPETLGLKPGDQVVVIDAAGRVHKFVWDTAYDEEGKKRKAKARDEYALFPTK